MEKELAALQKMNPGLAIHAVSDPLFARYGRLVQGLGGEVALDYARTHAIPAEGVVYQPAVAGLEADSKLMTAVSRMVDGGMPVQVGWCYGRNSDLNGLEYHKGSELLVAVTSVVLLVGHIDDITWKPSPAYETAKVEAFYVQEGAMVEMYGSTLHYAPIHVSMKNGFVSLIILPRDTNTALDFTPEKKGEDSLLFARNKWLLVHPKDAGDVKAGALVGLKGENIRVNCLD